MKKLITIVILAVLNSTVLYSQSDSSVTAAATPAPKKITGSVEMNYLRHYLWRGAAFGNNDVAQPVTELSYGSFTLSLAQNFNYVPGHVPKEFYTRSTFFDEQDVEIRYSKEWGRVSSQLSGMAYFYFFQPGSPNTAELYNWTGYNFYKGFSVFTENSVDVVQYPGAVYSNNGLLFEHTAKNNIKIEWSAYAGFGNAKFNTTYFNGIAGGINLLGTHIDISKEIGKYFIKLSAEKNNYVRDAVQQATAIKGTDNFAIAAGFNF